MDYLYNENPGWGVGFTIIFNGKKVEITDTNHHLIWHDNCSGCSANVSSIGCQ